MTAVAPMEERKTSLIRAARRDRDIVLRIGPSHPEFGPAFMRRYLPHYMRDEETGLAVEGAEWHPEFFVDVFGSLGKRARKTYLAPRGGAKSTIAGVAMPLAVMGLSGLALQGKLPYRFVPKRYLWIVQDTSEQAKQSMESILAETEENVLLRQDFPHLVPEIGRHNRPVADRDDDVVFNLGLRLQALGSGQKLRGRRHRQFRPDLCLVDDLENDEHVLTKYQRDKLDKWLSSSLLGALAKHGDLFLLGTLLHHDAVLARLRKRGGWGAKTFKTFKDETIPCPDHGWRVDPEDTSWKECDLCHGKGVVQQVTWPYRDHKWLAMQRKTMGSRSFNREYLHVVTDEEDKRFPKTWMRHRPCPHPLEEMRVRIGVDPAATEKTENDRCAIVVAAKKPGERDVYVLDAWADWVRGKKLRARVVTMHERYGGIVVAETVQVQEWLKQDLEDEGIAVVGEKPRNDKIVRAEPVSVMYENGQVTHVPELRDSDFEDELDDFPDGEHDDYVDALGYAIRGLSKGGGGGVKPAVKHRMRREKEPPPRDPRYDVG